MLFNLHIRWGYAGYFYTSSLGIVEFLPILVPFSKAVRLRGISLSQPYMT